MAHSLGTSYHRVGPLGHRPAVAPPAPAPGASDRPLPSRYTRRVASPLKSVVPLAALIAAAGCLDRSPVTTRCPRCAAAGDVPASDGEGDPLPGPVATKLRIETAADGSGTVVGATTLAIGQTLSLFAIARADDEAFVANVAVDWTLTGSIGDLSAGASAPSTVFTAREVGAGTITADHATLDDATAGPLTVTGGATLAVEPVYPAHAAWNTYVRDANPLLDEYEQAGVSCTGSEPRATGCIHGGEKRAVAVPGETSCAGLTLSEALDAFVWECKVKAGTATFFSRGLRPARGLRSLLTPSGWATNWVRVFKQGLAVGTSPAAVWGWTNPVAPLPDNSAGNALRLDDVDDDGAGPDGVFAAGTVFVLAESRVTPGYQLGLEAMALVLLDPAVLTWRGGATNGCSGGTCLVWVENTNRAWLEGRFEAFDAAGSAQRAIAVFSSVLSTLKSCQGNGADEAGAYLRFGALARVRDCSFSGNGLVGLNAGTPYTLVENVGLASNAGGSFLGGVGLMVRGLRAANTLGGVAVELAGADTTALDLVISNSGGVGLQISNDNVTVVGALVHNSTQHGVAFRSGGTARIAVTHLTTANNLWPVNIRPDGDLATLANVAVLNDTIALAGDDNQVANLAFGSTLESTANATVFSQNLLFDSGSQCLVTSGAAPGIGAGTCAAQDASTHAIHPGTNVPGAVVGKVASDDGANSSDNAGVAAYATILDWLRFDHRWRGWGRNGFAGFPDPSNVGPCTAPDDCVIWDFRLTAADTILKRRSGAGSSAAENEPFVVGAPCPTAVDGDRAVSDHQRRAWALGINAVEDNSAAGGDDDGLCEAGELCRNTFLVNAVELVGDRRGDDDGLCESDEACIYSPNFGADQGEGEPSPGTCVFTDGVVARVAMQAYPSP